MKKSRVNQLFLLIGMIVLVSSCNKTDDTQTQENENRLLSSYLSTYNITVTPTASGLYIIPKKEGTGATPQTGDFVLLNYSATWLSNGALYDTNDTATAKLNNIAMFQPLGGPFKFVLGSNLWGIGLSEGIHNMKEGGTARFIVPSNLWNNDYSTRIYDVELLKVYKDPWTFEQGHIAYYLDSISSALNKTPKLTLADSTKTGVTGVYYIETLKGTGDSIIDGKTVTLAYSGSLLPYKGLSKERLFGKSTSFSTILNNTQVIPGFAEGIRHMRKGGKAIVVIPYHRGYGADIQAYYNQIIIPQYSTLIYTLEIKDVY